MDVNYPYDGKFEDNVLIIGQTGCGKTTLLQKMAKNKLFGELKGIFWISKIPLSNTREKIYCRASKRMWILNTRKQ